MPFTNRFIPVTKSMQKFGTKKSMANQLKILIIYVRTVIHPIVNTHVLYSNILILTPTTEIDLKYLNQSVQDMQMCYDVSTYTLKKTCQNAEIKHNTCVVIKVSLSSINHKKSYICAHILDVLIRIYLTHERCWFSHSVMVQQVMESQIIRKVPFFEIYEISHRVCWFIDNIDI